jgi:hypothetical protein
MSLWLLVAKEIVLTAGGSITASLIFDPSFAENQPVGHQRPQ